MRICGSQQPCSVQVAWRQNSRLPYSFQRLLRERQQQFGLCSSRDLCCKPTSAMPDDTAQAGSDDERRASNAQASSSRTDSISQRQPQQQQQQQRQPGQQQQQQGGGYQSGRRQERGQLPEKDAGRFRAAKIRQKNPAAAAVAAAAPAKRWKDSGSSAPRPNRRESGDPVMEAFFKRFKGFFRIDRDIENTRDGFEAGLFRQMFIDAGLLNDDGSPGPPVIEMQERAEATGVKDPLHIGINVMLTSCQRWESVMVIVQDLATLFDEINVSTSMHRIAKLSRKYEVMRVKSHPGYPVLLHMVESFVTEFHPRQLANVFWAMATLGEERPSLAEGVSARLRESNLHDFKQQELSIIVWAFAVFGNKDTEAIDAIIDTMLEKGVDTFFPQALSNVMWSCATLEHTNERFLQAVAEDTAARHGEYSVQALTNTVWGAATLGFSDEGMLKAVAGEAVARLSDFNPQELSNILVAYARIGYVHIPLLEALERELAREGRLRPFATQALANSLWSFATLRYFPSGPCFCALIDEVSVNMDGLKEQELVNIIWACAKLGYHPGALMHTFCTQIGQMVHNFSSQATTSSLWALSVLQASREPVFMALVDRMATQPLDAIEPLQLQQLFQALMLARTERGTNEELLSALPDKIHHHGEALWKASVSRTRVSGFHQEVSAVLLRIGVPHLVEYVTPDGLFSVDIALRNGAQPIALEVDGPYHFTCNTEQPLGHTLLRRRLLRAKGWTVLSVPYFEWYSGGDNTSHVEIDKEMYMVEKLGSIGIAITWPPLDGAPPPPTRLDAPSQPQEPSRALQARQQAPMVGIQLEPVPAEEAADTPLVFVNGMRGKAVRPRQTRLTLKPRAKEEGMQLPPQQMTAPQRTTRARQQREPPSSSTGES